MMDQGINFQKKLAQITEHWSPRIIAQMNDYQFKLAKVQGEFVWHTHAETDEVFIVLNGTLEIQLPRGSVVLNEGEMFVVPKGLQHRPVARVECHILLIEPEGTVNTGEVVDERTSAQDLWI